VSGFAPLGSEDMQLATSAPNETPELVSRLLRRARQEPDCERAEVKEISHLMEISVDEVRRLISR
jgi:hypothetical protein